MAKKRKYKNRRGKQEMQKLGLLPMHCGRCKTNYWRHKPTPKNPIIGCGVCPHDAVADPLKPGHVVHRKAVQSKKIRH